MTVEIAKVIWFFYKGVVKNIMYQNGYILKLITPFYCNLIGLGNKKNHNMNLYEQCTCQNTQINLCKICLKYK